MSQTRRPGRPALLRSSEVRPRCQPSTTVRTAPLTRTRGAVPGYELTCEQHETRTRRYTAAESQRAAVHVTEWCTSCRTLADARRWLSADTVELLAAVERDARSGSLWLHPLIQDARLDAGDVMLGLEDDPALHAAVTLRLLRDRVPHGNG